MAKLGPHHHRDLADQRLVVVQGLLLQDGRNSSLFVAFSVVDFLELHVAVNFRLIRQTAHTSLMRPKNCVGPILLVLMRVVGNSRVSKNQLVRGFLVVVAVVLLLARDDGFLVLFDDLLHRKAQEALEREDLLGDKAVLFEVRVDDFPRVVLVNGVEVGS